MKDFHSERLIGLALCHPEIIPQLQPHLLPKGYKELAAAIMAGEPLDRWERTLPHCRDAAKGVKVETAVSIIEGQRHRFIETAFAVWRKTKDTAALKTAIAEA